MNKYKITNIKSFQKPRAACDRGPGEMSDKNQFSTCDKDYGE